MTTRHIKIFIFSLLFFLGILLRLLGLTFHGNDNYSDYKRIGHNVRTLGLAESYGTGYFPVAFLIFGLNDYLGSFTPSNWWWPYKGSNLIFEIAIVMTFLLYLKANRFKVLFMYWLNPWFLVPPAWAGFWDAPYVFFLLLAILALESSWKDDKKFLWAGFLFGVSFSIKPQSFAPLIIMMIYFISKYLRKLDFRIFLRFLAGLSILPAIFIIYFFLNGKPLYFLPKWYTAVMAYSQPFLVNSEINIWHTITRIIMFFQGKTGPIYSLNVYTFPYNLLEYLAVIVFFGLLFILIKRYTDRKSLPSFFFLKSITFASILLPQIGTRAHAYHFFPGSLFLLLLLMVENNRKLFILWLLSVAIHFYNIWWEYGLGQDIRNPFPLWGEPVISILGFVQFLISVKLIYIFLTYKHYSLGLRR